MISEKIVVVDDDPRIHQSLKAILSEYQLISFMDSSKALEFLSQPNEIKLVILDVCMPGFNGMEVLEKIKRGKDVAVIMITAHEHRDIVIESLRLHADDFLAKPFDIQELRERIKLLLKTKDRFDHTTQDPSNKSQRIRKFIEHNYHNASLEYIAKEMCLSTQYLGRLFGKHNEIGFRCYKLKIKMDKAMDLLKRSSLNVSEISYQLGYKNPESFMRAFKRYTKMPPGVYRSENQGRKP